MLIIIIIIVIIIINMFPIVISIITGTITMVMGQWRQKMQLRWRPKRVGVIASSQNACPHATLHPFSLFFSIDNSTVEQSYGKCTVEKIHRIPHYIHSLNFYISSSHIITLSVQVCFDSQQLIISSLFRFSEKLMLLNF